MNLTEDSQVIEKLPATTFDPPPRLSILPGTRRAYPVGFHAAAWQNIGYLVAGFAVAIKNRIAVRTRFRKCLPRLLRYPGIARVFRNVEMQDPAPAVFEDEETIQDPERPCWYLEEIHGRDHIPVITQKS
jgi:hypothetical protein